MRRMRVMRRELREVARVPNAMLVSRERTSVCKHAHEPVRAVGTMLVRVSGYNNTTRRSSTTTEEGGGLHACQLHGPRPRAGH